MHEESIGSVIPKRWMPGIPEEVAETLPPATGAPGLAWRSAQAPKGTGNSSKRGNGLEPRRASPDEVSQRIDSQSLLHLSEKQVSV